jgi:MFS family permease
MMRDVLARYVRSLTGFERDARLFLLATLATGAALSLWWIDFNLYLQSLGLTPAVIGVVATVAAGAGVAVAFPASLLSNRLGRRLVMLGGGCLMLTAFVLLLTSSALPVLFLAAACFSAGNSTLATVTAPFLVEHSDPDRRSELFAVQFAIANGTNVVAAIAGGLIAEEVARLGGFDAGGPEAYRVIVGLMAGLGILALLMLVRLRDDRPSAPGRAIEEGAGRAPAASVSPAAGSTRPGSVSRRRPVISDPGTFVRLILPMLLISLGAGQVIPFLNVFVRGKFGLELASLNLLFAITSLGTLAATLLQPALARRFGKIGSVVLVQGASLPFLVVLGFSPVFWTVAVAMAVRNSLMNAGNPIFTAFAMERVPPSERATLSAALGLLWSLGWLIGGPWYSLLQSSLGFDAGYTVNFVTIVVLYSLGTWLSWLWFGRDERRERRSARGLGGAAAAEG